MRITNKVMNNNMLRNLNNNMRRLDKINQELATGRQIQFASDDPVKAGSIMRLRSSLFENEQYIRNVDQGISWLHATDSVLRDVTSILHRARDLSLTGANETNDASAQKALADEIDQLMGNLVQMANTTHGGRHVFGGQETRRPPITSVDAAGAVGKLVEAGVHLKDDLDRFIDRMDGFEDEDLVNELDALANNNVSSLADPAEARNRAVEIVNLISGSPDLDLIVLNDLRDEIAANPAVWDTSDPAWDGQVLWDELADLPPADMETLISELRSLAIKDDVTVGTEWKTMAENEPDQFKEILGLLAKESFAPDGPVHDHVKFIGEDPDSGDTIYIAENADRNPVFLYGYGDQFVHYTGGYGDRAALTREIGVNADVQLNLLGSDVFGDTFSVLAQASAHLHGGNSEALSGEVLANFDVTLDKLLGYYSEVGAKTNRLELAEERLKDLHVNLTALFSESHDIDVAEAIMHLQSEEYTYRTALAVGARIMQPSLVDFLR